MKLIEKYLNIIKRYDGDTHRKIETINMACHSLKNEEDILTFLEAIIETNPLAAVLVLMENRMKLSGNKREAFFIKVAESCNKPIVQSSSGQSHWDADFPMIDVYTTAVYLNERQLFSNILNLTKSTAVSQLEEVFSFLATSRNAAENTLRALCWLYELLPQEDSNRLLRTIVFDKTVKYAEDDSLTEQLNRLSMLAVEDGNFEYLFYLSQLFVGLRYERTTLSEATLMKKIFSSDSSEPIYYGLLLTEVLSKYDSPDDISGIESWWSAVCKYADTSNPVWMDMLGWYEMYILSRRIYYNSAEADRYISEAAPVRQTSMDVTARSVKTVQRAVETLIASKSRRIPEYLEKIKAANIYRFYNGCMRKEYCSDSQSTIDITKIVPLLAESGYSQKEITEIYLNSYLRRLLRMDYFLRNLFATTSGTLNTGSSIDLKNLLGEYSLPVAVEADHKGKIFLKPYGLHVGYMWIENDWKTNNPVTAARLLKNGADINVRITACDINYFACRTVPVDADTGEILEDIAGEGNRFPDLMELLQEVEHQGTLTTEMNLRITNLTTESLDKEQQITLSIQYLKCCASIAKHNNSVRYFVNMITSPYYKTENYYRHNRMHANAPVAYYDRHIFKQVIDCWNILKNTQISADALFFIYINTILKHCISFSSLIYNSHYENNGVIHIASLLSKYTDYFFSGKIINVDMQKRIVTILPTEFSVKNRVQNDSYIYPIPPEDTSYFRLGSECYFKIKNYKVKEYTFILSELKLNKALRDRAPEIMFLNAVLNTSYNLDLSIHKIRDINTNGLKLNSNETSTLMSGILNCIHFRSTSPSEMSKFMAIMQRNNPWKFSLSPLPDISSFPHSENNATKSERILEKLCSDFAPENIVKIYFNSPVKSFIPVTRLLEIYINANREPKELSDLLIQYPLTITAQGDVNYLLSNEGSHKATGTYTITGYSDGQFQLEACSSPSVPDDYNESQLQQIINSVYHEQNSENRLLNP